MIGSYVASPDMGKVGIVVGLQERGCLDILWEGHVAPYTCLPTAAAPISPDLAPLAVRIDLQKKLKQFLERAIAV